MLNSTHYTVSSANTATASNLYNENLTYDSRGNILTLNRQGYYTSGATCAYNTIDNLTYNYSANTNKLNTITESASATYKNFGFNPGAGGAGYTYDVNGNLKSDSYKGITNITYNYLNLPSKIEWSTTKSIEFVYTAAGEKLAKTVKTGTTTNYIQHYAQGIEYNSASGTNRRVEAIYYGEGRFFNTNTGTSTPTYRTEFSIKDHLGNARVTFTDLNANGKIDVTNNATTNEIIQENHYYAFGMAHEGPWLMNHSSKDNNYLYNYKELNADHDLKWYDYGARFYDAVIGRWHVVDPMGEVSPSWSPYNYVENNPNISIDPTGMESEDALFNAAKKEGATKTIYNVQGYNDNGGETSNVRDVEKSRQIIYDSKGNATSVRIEYENIAENDCCPGAAVMFEELGLVLGTDLAIPEPTDAIPWKWVGYTAAFVGVALYAGYEVVSDNSEVNYSSDYNIVYSKGGKQNVWPSNYPKPNWQEVDWSKSDAKLADEISARVGDTKKGPGTPNNNAKKVFRDKRPNK